MRFLNMGTGMSSGHGGRLVEQLFTAPFQVRSATVQHRRHGGVNGRGASYPPEPAAAFLG
jgi:hypothetical protein